MTDEAKIELNSHPRHERYICREQFHKHVDKLAPIVDEAYRITFNKEPEFFVEISPAKNFVEVHKSKRIEQAAGTVDVLINPKDEKDVKYLISVVEYHVPFLIAVISHEIGHIPFYHYMNDRAMRAIETMESENRENVIIREIRMGNRHSWLAEIAAYSSQNRMCRIAARKNIGGLGDEIAETNRLVLNYPLASWVKGDRFDRNVLGAALTRSFDFPAGRLYDIITPIWQAR